jgi:tRNA(Ile)-lysidine synthase
VYEIVKDFGFHSAQVHEIIALIDSETGKYITSSSHRAIKNRNWLIIAPLTTEEAETILIEEGVTNIQFAIGNLQIAKDSVSEITLKTSNQIALLDLKEIKFPLLLRKWKQGDYFYPLGMKKKKKLARFFIDQKLSKTEKEKVWVLEMDKKIIWIVNRRIDDRFKVTDKTERGLKITFNQTE